MTLPRVISEAGRLLRRNPVAAASAAGVLVLFGIYYGVLWWASMPPERRLPPAARQEAMALLQRARDTGDVLPEGGPRHAALKRKVRGPIFIKLHLKGELAFSYKSAAPVVIWDALKDAAGQVRENTEIAALNETDRRQSRFKVDIAQGRAPMLTWPEILMAISLVPGVDGLGAQVGDKTAYLDPDELLRRGLVTGYQPFKFVREFKAGLHIKDADELLARQLGQWKNRRWVGGSGRRYFRFRTAGFVEAPFVDGRRGPPLPVYRGNTPPPKFNRQGVIDACVAGGNYILRQLMREAGPVDMIYAYRNRGDRRGRLYTHPRSDVWRLGRRARELRAGQFKYIYYPLTDNYEAAGYSLPRHAGTAYALALLYGKLKGRKGVSAAQIEKFRAGARVAIKYLADRVRDEEKEFDRLRRAGRAIRGLCYNQEKDFVCVRQSLRSMHTDLGSSALPLVAIMEYQRQTGDRSYEDLGRKLANFILYMQKSDGEYCHRYDVRKAKRDTHSKLLYYSGEAALAMALAYHELKDPRYRTSVKRALDYLTGENYKPLTLKFLFGEDHWTCIAAEAAWPHVKSARYNTFCSEFAAFQRRQQFHAGDKAVFDYEGGYGITPFFPPHLTPAGSRSEAMVSAYDLTRHHGKTEEIIRQQIVRAFKYIVRHQVRLENSYLFARPEHALGAIRKSPIKYDVRIDYVQHTVAAMVRALDYVPE